MEELIVTAGVIKDKLWVTTNEGRLLKIGLEELQNPNAKEIFDIERLMIVDGGFAVAFGDFEVCVDFILDEATVVKR